MNDNSEPNKPPVLLVHGMWSQGETLIEVQQAFEAEGYEVHAPSLPFHVDLHQHTTESRKQLANAGVHDYLSFLESYVQQLSAPPILVGHSMGGLLVQLLGTRVPVACVITLSSGAPAGINAFRMSVVRTIGHNFLKFPLWKNTTDIGIKNIQYGIANTQSEELQREVAQKVTLESGRVATEMSMWFVFKRPPTYLDVSKVNYPVLLLSGLEDKITPAVLQEKINTLYQGKATLKLLDGVCHWTVGGSNFPKIRDEIFGWLNAQNLAAA